MRLLLAAVVLFLASLFLGRRMGRSAPSRTNKRNSGTSVKSVARSAGRRAGKNQLAAQSSVDQRGQSPDPQAHLRLAQAKEHAHDLLERIALEVKQREEEPRLGRGQCARVARGSRCPLTRLPETVDLPASGLDFLLEGCQKPGKLPSGPSWSLHAATWAYGK